MSLRSLAAARSGRGLLLALGLAAGCDHQVPLAPDATDPANSISGELVLLGPAPANVFVLVYAADDPPPPEGFGRPVTFAAVPADRFSGDNAGAHSAPYAVSGLEDGNYLVTALVDVDGDFHPLVGSAAGASCGDWGGAHVDVDPTTGALVPAVVQLSAGELVDDVTVLASVPRSLERPAFELVDPGTPHLLGSGDTIPVRSVEIDTPALQLGPVMDPAAPGACETAFATFLTVGPGGFPSDVSLSPVFVLQPVEQPEGESWAILAGWDAAPLVLGGELSPDDPAPTYFTELELVLGYAQVTGADGVTEGPLPVTSAPRGAYAITAMNADGQTWTVPNDTSEAAPSGAFDPAGQGIPVVLE